jgi:uncharacterized membrane protein
MVPLGPGSATAASADGSVVVGRHPRLAGPEGGSPRAFRWTAATGAVGLGVLPGHTSSEANGASADGPVVVGVSTLHAGEASDARRFRWTSAGGMADWASSPRDHGPT